MEMERITIDLPIVKIEANSPIFSCDFAKEHYPMGLFIADDGVMRHLIHYDGVYVNAIPCPHDVIEKHLVERAVVDYHRDMGAIEDRLSQISRLLDCINGGILASETRVRDDIEELDDKLSSMSKSSGDGANVIDIAKAFAVISKPELIKELNK